ncbi:MAG: SGNH/GDSL hydrolase family protein [Kiritimatiellae bacterium]|nr:SGNH/GDSL hydrolase family protein [Kiritimatiellia bacterium]
MRHILVTCLGMLAAMTVTSMAETAATSGVTIAIEGDSRSAPPSPTTNFWPDYWREMSPLAKGATIKNFAVGGDTLANMVKTYAAQAQRLRPTSGQVGYFILYAACNDLGTGMNASGAATYRCATQLWAMARADGYKIVACTEAGARSWPASNKTECAAFNALVRSNTNLYDYLLEPDVYLPPSSTVLYIEGTHFTDAGSRAFAEMVDGALSGTGPNLIRNGGFEGGAEAVAAAGWKLENGVSATNGAGESSDGEGYLRCACAGDPSRPSAAMFAGIPVKPRTGYIARAFVEYEGGGSPDVWRSRRQWQASRLPGPVWMGQGLA